MPNWCNNTVEIAHKDPAKLKELIDAFNEGKFCAYAKPVPEELNIVAGRVGNDQDEAQKKLEADMARNKEKYGYETWYDFCVNEWGTKWDVGGDGCFDPADLEEGATSTTICFDSAWAPPVGAYDALAELGFEVRAMYYEPGMAYCGTWDNGYDECYEFGGETSETVRDAIGDALDDEFGISMSMAEYEVENEIDEELYNFVTEGAEAKKASNE